MGPTHNVWKDTKEIASCKRYSWPNVLTLPLLILTKLVVKGTQCYLGMCCIYEKRLFQRRKLKQLTTKFNADNLWAKCEFLFHCTIFENKTWIFSPNRWILRQNISIFKVLGKENFRARYHPKFQLKRHQKCDHFAHRLWCISLGLEIL